MAYAYLSVIVPRFCSGRLAMLKRACAIAIAFALFGTAPATDAAAVPAAAQAINCPDGAACAGEPGIGAGGDAVVATASFDPPLCPESLDCKPPLEPPNLGEGGCTGGGVFGSGVACQVNGLRPLPEPTTLALLGIALLGFAATLKRKRS